MILKLRETFSRSLPADSVLINQVRQVFNACFSFVSPRVPSDPELVHVSSEAASLLGIEHDVKSKAFLDVFFWINNY